MRIWVGGRQVAVRAELIPVKVPRSTVSDGDGPGFAGLGHSVELEEHRQAVETVTDAHGRASGASIGTTVTEAIHTGNAVARAAGPSYSEVGATQQSVSLTRSDGSVRIATATTTQAHGEYVTRYRLRLSLDITDTGTPEGADGTDGADSSAVDGTGRGGPFGALGRRTGQ
ncbi:hypothetical protein NGM37_33970, partial [Streptomyces sp. TRM76130]|nr:hypothetical protein [Streptomyces sp. TRM76130]